MTRFGIDPRLYILFTVLLFLVPLPWLAAWVAAVCFHEFCHLAVVKLYGGNVCSFTVGLGGANMECIDLTDSAYLISILAGPVGGLGLVLLGRWFPRLAICSWFLSFYNLLPVLPLDGGQAMRILIKNSRLFLVVERISLFIISILAICICFFADFGPLPLVIAVSLWIKNRKRPCKGPQCRVQ